MPCVLKYMDDWPDTGKITIKDLVMTYILTGKDTYILVTDDV